MLCGACKYVCMGVYIEDCMIVRFIKKDSRFKKSLSLALFAGYLVVLLYFTIFSESLGRKDVSDELRYNLVLFAEIKRFWIYRRQLGMWACFMNIAGNVLAFMPCGYLIPAMFTGRRSFADAVFTGFMISFIIECTQLVFKVGSFDVDDLLLNTIGTAAGYILWLSVHRFADIKVQERQVTIREIDADE